MDDQLYIHVKIADHEYTFKSLPEEETFLRDAVKMIRDRIDVHRSRGMRDTQDILAVVAVECLVANLKTDDQARRTQKRIYDKVSQIDQITTAPSA